MGIDWGKVVTGAFGIIQDKLSGKNISSASSSGSSASTVPPWLWPVVAVAGALLLLKGKRKLF